jgi:beta-N-acetylhexosaminidase
MAYQGKHTRRSGPGRRLLPVILAAALIGGGIWLFRDWKPAPLKGALFSAQGSASSAGSAASSSAKSASQGAASSAGSGASSSQGSASSKGDSQDGSAAERAAEILSGMTDHEKICQLFVVTPEELTGVGTAVAAGSATRACLEKYPVGGLIYFSPNLKSTGQVERMISHSQQYSEELTGIPLFISVDEEGGEVSRCASKLGTTHLEPMYTYRNDGVETARANAKTLGEDIAQFGFNLDYAPVADTWSNSANTVIGQRAYSDDYEQAAQLVAAAVQGFHDGGVCCTLKHFPGHGDTSEDSHKTAAYVNKTLQQLQKEDFLPFESGIRAGADLVMVGHLTVPDVDSLPASLSRKFITEILRGDLGFDGVVITDSLSMAGLTDRYSASEIARRTFEAGTDLLLCVEDLPASVSALESAVQSGEITAQRLDESVTRILTLKINAGILT